MSWLTNLSRTYENNAKVIGQFEKKRNGREYALIPISHTTQSAHIEVNLDGHGNFASAKVIEKSDANTIIPCTEASASRTSAPVPYPLFDKLVYVAGDFAHYGDVPKGTPYEDYMDQLLSWCESSAAHDKVKSVYTYLRNGTLMADLIREKVLWVDGQNRLIDKWTPELEQQYGEKPDIFKVIASDQSAAFVRFAVQVPGVAEARLWRDPSVQQSFIQFYERKLTETDLCYVTGDYLPFADKHASRIRNSADKSKLISANDTGGFTFRGRFHTSRDAASVSYEVSQKAHNALKWLIERQGMTVDGRTFVVWGTEQLEMPDLFGDTFSLYQEEDQTTAGDLTHKEFAGQIRRAIGGYRYNGDYKAKAKIIIMVLDAATPGRMSIVYYRDMEQEVFLDRLQDWHETCCWQQRHRRDADKQIVSFLAAPATRDIAFAAYGPRANDKLIKGLMERMLPCILDARKIPLDIVRSAVSRASNPVGMEEWEWEKTLSIACALVNKTHEKEGYEVSLDVHNTDRNYLFGRMLAIADVLERRALGREEKRATNAVRYMNAFAQHPARTWRIIQSNLQPYQARMGTDAGYYNRLLDEVGDQLSTEHYTDKPLSGLYLLGFYSQRNELYKSRKDREAEAGQEDGNKESGEKTE